MDQRLKEESKIELKCGNCGKRMPSEVGDGEPCACPIHVPEHPEAKSSSGHPLPVINARYEALEIIGRGGMGSVYKVKDKQTDSIFAVKILDQSLIQEQAAHKRFEQEAEAAKRLNHPNLVSVFEHGTTDDGAPFIVMDYLDGQALTDVLKESKILETGRAIKIFRDICEALVYAHQDGVIHRDIKPTNIILTNVGQSTERAHIVDFGIAKVMPTANRETHDLTQTGEIFGSPHYMSPEQCLGFMLDNRSDIYSLGCLMYECLTGSTPFEGANPIQVVVKHINEAPSEFPKAVRTDKLIEKLEQVVLRCLDKEKTERYQSVEDVLKDLQAIESGKPVTPRLRTGKPKPMFTKRQTIGFLVVFIGLTIYGTITATIFNNEVGGKVLGVLLSCVCLSGVWVFFSSALEVYRKRIKVLTESSGWQILLLVILGIGCLTALQWPAMITIGFQNMPAGEIWWQIYFWNGAIHLLSLFCLVVAAICSVLFRRPNKFNPLVMSLKFLLIACLTICFVRFGAPEQTGKISAGLAQICIPTQPVVAKRLLLIATHVDEKPEYLQRLAEVYHKLDMHDAELKTIERVIAIDPGNSWHFGNAAESFRQHKMYDQAFKYYAEQIRKERAEQNNESRLAELLSARSDVYKEVSDYENAKRDLLEALKYSPYADGLMYKLALVDCFSGDLESAKKLLETVSAKHTSDFVKQKVLLAIVYKCLGNQAMANQSLDEVASEKSSENSKLRNYAKTLRVNGDSAVLTENERKELLNQLGFDGAMPPLKPF